MVHATKDSIRRGLIGGGLRSRRPTSLHIWMIQWAPGGCLIGWLAAALVVPAGRTSAAVEFIVCGMLLGVTLWAAIALSSLPVFVAIKPRVDRASELTRRQGAALAFVGATPLALVALALRPAFLASETSFSARSPGPWMVEAALCVVAGLGMFVAAELWRRFGRPDHDPARPPLHRPLDISPAVRVKEDLEVLRIILANSVVSLLNLFVLIAVPSLVLFAVLVSLRAIELPQPVSWLMFVPLVMTAVVIPGVAVLASYQMGLWHFVPVRASGVVLFAGAVCALVVCSSEPFQELQAGVRLGYSRTAWLYTGLVVALTVPAFVVTGSAFRMSVRLSRLAANLEPVVHGWRAGPLNVWAHALRTLCLPTFLVALPKGRTRPLLLFTLSAVASALHTGFWFSLVVQPPALLGGLVRSALGDRWDASGESPWPTIGAAITAASFTQPSSVAPRTIVLVLPFVLVLVFVVAGGWLSQKAGATLLRRAQRRAALAYQSVIRLDSREPVLFLRPFREDQRLFQPPARSLLAKVWRLRNRTRTLDEIVLDAASPVGPVMALGAPKDTVAPLGAARLYVSEAEWQHTVSTLASRSRAVIIYMEEGAGILWELEHLMDRGHLPKTLCILNPDTSLPTIDRAIDVSRRSGSAASCGILEQIRDEISRVPTAKVLVGVRFTDGGVSPIYSEDASDYTYWCMVNLLLLAVT